MICDSKKSSTKLISRKNLQKITIVSIVFIILTGSAPTNPLTFLDVNAIENDFSTKDKFKNQITVENNSSLDNTAEKPFTDIPEELVLQGTEFKLYWNVNGTNIDIINDKRFNVEFVDTDSNGIVDRIEWDVPMRSEQKFILEGNTNNIYTLVVTSKLQTMKEKIDPEFYEKTLQMMNQRTEGKLGEFIASTRSDELSTVFSQTENPEYYSVIIMVKKTSDENLNPEIVAKENKDQLVELLESEFDAKNIFKAETLSFVTARIPAQNIAKLVDYDFVFKIGDGERSLSPSLDDSKTIINATNILPADDNLDGYGVTVAVVDTGISQHDDLDDRIILNIECDLFDCQPGAAVDLQGGSGHGTHVAGIIAGTGQSDGSNAGIAPGADLYNIQIALFTVSSIIAWDFAVTNGADIISHSISGIGDCADNQATTTFELALDEMVDAGVLLVNSAGNNAASSTDFNSISNPSCSFNVIAVGNLDDNDSPTIPGAWDIHSTSSKGPSNGPFTSGRLKPEIVAPGQGVFSPDKLNSYSNFGGTSSATPHVSGTSALIKQINPQYIPIEIKAALLGGADYPSGIKSIVLNAAGGELTATVYEASATSSPVYSILNSWGLGILNTEKSLDLVRNSHIVSDKITQTPPGGNKEYHFTVTSSELGTTQRILLTWLSHGFSTDRTDPVPASQISDLNLKITKPDSSTIESNSQLQNNEFIIFDVDQTGSYTITVSAPFVDATVGTGLGGQEFALASTIPIDEANISPVAVNDDIEAEEQALVTIPLTPNDDDPDGNNNNLSIFSVDDRDTEGIINIGSNFVTFRSNPNFLGETTFRYTLTDGNGGFDIGKVSVNVTESSVVMPTANPDTAQTLKDTSKTIDVLFNDEVAEPGSMITGVNSVDPNSVQGGTVTNNGNDVTYTPPATFTGMDTFTYTAIDEDSRISNAATVTVQVQEIPSGGENLYLGERQLNTILLYDITTGTSQDTFISAAGNGGLNDPNDMIFDSEGSLYVSSGIQHAVLKYFPNGGFDKVFASDGNTNLGTPKGLAFDLSGNLYVASEAKDKILKITPAGVMSIFIDDSNLDEPNGISFDTSGRLYVADNVDDDILRYNSDGSFDTTFVFGGTDGLSNPRDIEFDSSGNLYVISFTTTTTEIMRFNSAGQPDGVSGNSGDATFATTDLDDPRSIDFDADGILYVVDDDADSVFRYDTSGNIINPPFVSGVNTPIALVMGNTPPANNSPVAGNDTPTTDEDVLLDNFNVISNDIDDDSISVSSVTSPSTAGGTVTNNGDGTIDYQSLLNFNGNDSFSYTITDSFGETDTASVTITVNPINDMPNAVDDAASVDEDTSLINFNILANDDDVDLPDDFIDILSVDMMSTEGGNIVNHDNGTINYSPAPDFNGIDTFSYTIHDSFGENDTATVTITINPINDSPTITFIPSVLTGALENTLFNYDVNATDPDGDALSFFLDVASSGMIIDVNTGLISWTPNNSQVGDNAVIVRVEDGNGGSDSTGFTIIVDPIGIPHTLTINTLNLNGTSNPGFFTTIHENGTLIHTGFAPVIFNGTEGITYTVETQSFFPFLFHHWEDNSIVVARNVTLNSDVNVTAYFIDSTGDVTAPVVSANPIGGAFANSVNVTLSVTDNIDPSPFIHFTTDGSMPNTNNTLYTNPITITDDTILRFIAGDAAGNLSPVSTEDYVITSPGNPVLTINTFNLNGTSNPGFYTTIHENGTLIHTGFTPVIFNATEGITYTVETQDYQGVNFHHWEDNSTVSARNVTLNSDITIIAYYDDTNNDLTPPIVSINPTGGTFVDSVVVTMSATDNADPSPIIYYTTNGTPATNSSTLYIAPLTLIFDITLNFIAEDASGNTSPVSTEAYIINSSSIPKLTINTLNLNGTSNPGFFTTIHENGTLIHTGFSPVIFNATQGTTYTIETQDYQGVNFHHWENNSTVSARNVTFNSDTIITAYYDDTNNDLTPPVVSINPTGGTFVDSVVVTMSATDNADPSPIIYYTTDGTPSTNSSTVYIAPITILVNTTLNFIAEDASGNTSPVSTEAYDITP